MGPEPLHQFDSIKQTPRNDRRVIHCHLAIQKHQINVAIADRSNIRTADRLTAVVNCHPLTHRRPT